MLVIRQSQMEAFREQPRRLFEQEMADYLRDYFPFEAGGADLDEWVRSGLAQAGQYGFLGKRESALYLALMGMLGAGFLEDPAMPWARSMVCDGSRAPEERMGLLFERAVEFLEQTCGPRGVWYDRAVVRLLRHNTGAFDRRAHPRAVAGSICEDLTRLYPQKVVAIGGRSLRELVGLAEKQARNPREWFARAACMFYLGVGFAADACFPWATASVSCEEMYRNAVGYWGRYLDWEKSNGR